MKGNQFATRQVSLELYMIINDAGLREDIYANEFPLISNNDFTRLNNIEHEKQLCYF